jgi:hypothetical protein
MLHLLQVMLIEVSGNLDRTWFRLGVQPLVILASANSDSTSSDVVLV